MKKVEPIPFNGPITTYLPDTATDCTPATVGSPSVPNSDFILNISTIDREAVNSKQYVFQTLCSLLLGGYKGEINLHIGQGPDSYLEDVEKYSRVKVHRHRPLPMKSFANVVDNWLQSISEDKHYLFLEDDVILCENWHNELTDRVRLLYSLGYSKFVLAMAQPSHHGYSELPVAIGSKAAFTGAHGLYMTDEAIDALYPHILGEFEYWQANQNYHITMDMSIKYAMMRSGTKLFHCVPSLIKHIGILCSLTRGETQTIAFDTDLFGQPPKKKRVPKLIRRAK